MTTDLNTKMKRSLSKVSDGAGAWKGYLLEHLDLDALGPTDVAARFTVADLRRFLRERGL